MGAKISVRPRRLGVALLAVALIALAGCQIDDVESGVYNGPGAVEQLERFGSFSGRAQTYATDYVPYSNGWATDFNPTWLVDPWSRWVAEEPGRRLVLGLPLLQESHRGQFALGAAGAFDQHFVGLGRTLVAKGLGHSVIRLGYEANNPNIGPWQATDDPAGYVRMYRHVVSVLRAIPGARFTFDWNPCTGLTGGRALTSYESFYPGNDVVDIIGQNVYDVKWRDPGVTPAERWSHIVNRPLGLKAHRDFARAHRKPISFPEWGLYAPGDQYAGGGDNPYFVDRMADWMAANDVVYQAYFNWDWGGGVLSDFPNAAKRYQARF
ncbi:hypothetical protein [Iamia sp.]|uniref:hypothetical protein n=1 Tax=Iamia sp. TaxID=2722710 RepID=UPI002D0C4A50|nr:hypothetical protein [Iamia sp.]HXH58135.1 hypothetical protein [Iamia sp.]